MKELTLSACMMVKNEEKLLPGCLKSIKDHVDEIVIVDTGSTDQTVSIAESFGARVYHHPWENHFSKHRNQSMSYAKGDWILIIDADEELILPKGKSLHQLLRMDNDIDSILLPIDCSTPNGIVKSNLIRIVRNNREIFHEGRVHNCLVGIRKSRFIKEIKLFHHGYNLGQKVDERKFKRTTELLNLDILDNPQSPRPHHFLAASYMSQKMYVLASQSAERAIALFETTKIVPHNYLWSLYIAAASRLALGEDEKAEVLAHKAISFFSDHLDSHFVLCSIYMKRNDWDLFEKHREAYLAILKAIPINPSRFGEIVQNSLPVEWLVHLWAGVMALTADKPSEAEEYFQLSRKVAGSDIHFFQELSGLLESKGRRSDAEKAEFNLADCLFHKGEYKSAAHIAQNILQKSPVPPVGAYRFSGLSHFHMGNFTAAISALEKMIECDPDLVEPYVYIAKMAIDSLDFETCIAACDQLLRILGLDRNVVLHSLTELGVQFFRVAESLIKNAEFGLARPCVDIGRSLTKMDSPLQGSAGNMRSLG